MTTQSPAYAQTIHFPGTEISTQVTDANEIRRSMKGHYIYKIDYLTIKVIPKNAISGTDSMGRKHIDYSEMIDTTDIIKEADGVLYARYKRSFYPLDCFVCSYVAQPCIYV